MERNIFLILFVIFKSYLRFRYARKFVTFVYIPQHSTFKSNLS